MIEIIKTNKAIIKYIFFGAATTAVNWVFYILCIKAFFLSVTVSNIIAWWFSILFAYLTNKLFVFESHSKTLKMFIKEMFLFFGSRIFSGIVDVLLPLLLLSIGLTHTIFGVQGFVAKIVTAVVVIVLNYALSKIFVFKKTGESNSFSNNKKCSKS